MIDGGGLLQLGRGRKGNLFREEEKVLNESGGRGGLGIGSLKG